MKIAITGGTGLVGSALRDSLIADGHEVLVLSRTPGAGRVFWDPAKGEIDSGALVGIDAMVNLAGRNVGSRWTEAIKQEIRDSRVEGTALLAKTLAALQPVPPVFINASAIGYYGSQREDELTEESASGDSFFADVTQAWEAATAPAEAAGIRTVHLRIGAVLSQDGGALAKLLPPFKLGLGGPVGDGQMVMSWIALDDLVALIRFAIDNASVSGSLNATAPKPVTNAEFTQTLAAVLHRPAFLPAPAFALKLVFGQMAEETILSSLRVLPRRAQEKGFKFRFPDLQPALEHVLS